MSVTRQEFRDAMARLGAAVNIITTAGPAGRGGFTASAALQAELQAHVKGKLAPYEYPKEIEFIDALPMTTTGKVQRRVLRLQEEERARKLAASQPKP